MSSQDSAETLEQKRSSLFDVPLTRLWEEHGGFPHFLEECLTFLESRPNLTEVRLFLRADEDDGLRELTDCYENDQEARLRDTARPSLEYV